MQKIYNSYENHISGVSNLLRIYEKYILYSLRFFSGLQYIFYGLICFYISKYTIRNEKMIFISLLFLLASSISVLLKLLHLKKLEYYFKKLGIFLLCLCSCIFLLYGLHALMYCLNNANFLINNSYLFINANNGKFHKLINVFRLLIIPISGLMCIISKITEYKKKTSYDQVSRVNFFDGSKINVDISNEKLEIPTLHLFFIIFNWIMSRNSLSSSILIIDMLMKYKRFVNHKKYTFLLPMIFSCAVTFLTIFTNYFNVMKLPWLNIKEYIC